jgi:hypothetical protein
VTVIPGSAGIIGLPHVLHNNFKTFDVPGPRGTLLVQLQ